MLSEEEIMKFVDDMKKEKGVVNVFHSSNGIEAVEIELVMDPDTTVRWRICPLSTCLETRAEILFCGHKTITARVKTAKMDKYDPAVGMGVSMLKAFMKLEGRWQSTKSLSDSILHFRSLQGSKASEYRIPGRSPTNTGK